MGGNMRVVDSQNIVGIGLNSLVLVGIADLVGHTGDSIGMEGMGNLSVGCCSVETGCS